MKRSAVTILLSLFLACLGYQIFIYYFPVLKSDAVELLTVIIICTLVPAVAIVLAVATLPEPKSKTTRRPQVQPQPQVPQVQPQPTAKRPNLNPREEQLSRKLIELVNGDQDAAQWLFYQSKQANPDRDIVWHLEQVIQDIIHYYATQPTTPLPQPPHRQQQVSAQSLKQQELERQLISLLHGDHKTAQRLVQLSLERNGQRNIEWHLDKVIYDLVRDRGGKPDPTPYVHDYRAYRDC